MCTSHVTVLSWVRRRLFERADIKDPVQATKNIPIYCERHFIHPLWPLCIKIKQVYKNFYVHLKKYDIPGTDQVYCHLG